MKIVFISNFFNHHQKPLSDALYELTHQQYRFVETKPITEERLQMGWGGEELPAYVMKNYVDADSFAACQTAIDEADVVILGSAPYELIENRLRDKKLTFCYAERVYKTGYELYKWPVRVVRLFSKYTRHKKLYMLCASAYTAGDFAITGTFINKAYKWGYFTEVKRFADIDALIAAKKPMSILWTARFLGLKHPEAALYVAKRLKDEHYSFSIDMIGSGERYDEIEKQIEENGLQDCVHLLGSMLPHQVREHMEQSEIFMFTSDKNEGWGAVLNESMNSGCAVVTSHAIGSVPFLLEDTKNGLIYKDGDLEDLYKKVKYLLDHKEERVRMGKAAYETMSAEWNPHNAAEKFLKVATSLLNDQRKASFFAKGVCSKAPIIGNHWYK